VATTLLTKVARTRVMTYIGQSERRR
jgi:hypothetical protein